MCSTKTDSSNYTFKTKYDYEQQFVSFVEELTIFLKKVSNHTFIGSCDFHILDNMDDSQPQKIRVTFDMKSVCDIPLSTRAYLSYSDGHFAANSNIILKGTLVKVEMSILNIDFEMKKNFLLEKDEYTIEFVCNLTTVSRMSTAISNVINSTNHSLVSYLLKPEKLLEDNYDDDNKVVLYQSPNLPVLSSTQVKILSEVMTHKFTVIQGPPGTGKTVTSACIVYNLIKTKKARVLICTPSNTAADNIARAIQKTKVNVVRVYASSREDNCSLPDIALHNIVYKQNSSLKYLMKMFKKNLLSREERELMFRLKQACATTIINKAEAVICTLCSAGDDLMSSFTFSYVLIDEATQCTEPECIIPLKNCKKVILVGDHKQLGPVVTCPKLMKTDFKMSLFERILGAGVNASILDMQFRMHPSISNFPSECFYGGLLKNGVSSKDRPINNSFCWLSKSDPILFLNHTEPEKECSPSYANTGEVSLVVLIIMSLKKAGVDNIDIGVVTPYKAQTVRIKQKFSSYRIQNIEVDSIDSFQGREKDYIILSCVRSNDDHKIGFLKDTRRLNVSITRAKYGLIIIGNGKTLSVDSTWERLILHYCEKNVVMCVKNKSLVPDYAFMDMTKKKEISNETLCHMLEKMYLFKF